MRERKTYCESESEKKTERERESESDTQKKRERETDAAAAAVFALAPHSLVLTKVRAPAAHFRCRRIEHLS